MILRIIIFVNTGPLGFFRNIAQNQYKQALKFHISTDPNSNTTYPIYVIYQCDIKPRNVVTMLLLHKIWSL